MSQNEAKAGMEPQTTTTPKTQRFWIIGGAALLQIMLLIAAFSLGVYVERYGLSDAGLNYQGAGGPPLNQPGQAGVAPAGMGNPPQGLLGPQPLPPGLTEPPQLVGRLLRSLPDALELATSQGPRPVLLDQNTLYRDHTGQTLTLEDLKPGSIVAVYGVPGPDGRNLLATEIVLLPPARQQPPGQP